jgi:nitrate/nitrite transport system substrate-binding protein
MRTTQQPSDTTNGLRARLRALIATAGLLAAASLPAVTAQAAAARIESPDLKLGFIKLTDCAPLVIALEKGFFEDEGLFVTLEAQANRRLKRLPSGQGFPAGWSTH